MPSNTPRIYLDHNATCPMRPESREAMRGAMASEGFWGTLSVAMGVSDAAVAVMPLQYNNYILFSTVTYKNERLSTGCLGNVVLGH